MLHNGLAAALILAIMGQTRYDIAVAEAQERLFEIVSGEHHATGGEGDERWGPHKRGLLALQKIHERQKSEPANTQQENPTAQIQLGRSDSHEPSQLVSSPPAEGLQGGPDLEYPLFSTQAEDFSSFLPEGSDIHDLMVDDIFDSVLWGDYREESGKTMNE